MRTQSANSELPATPLGPLPDRLLRGVSIGLSALLSISIAATASDDVPRRLAERLLERHVVDDAGPRAALGATAPRVLWRHSGDDNACSLLLRSDADGDRVPDAVVGWDLFKTGDNLEVLSGGAPGRAEQIWSLETADGISGGYFSDIDQLTTFPDVDGDGIEELLTGTSGGGRSATIYDGATGVVLQSFDTYLGLASGWVYDVEVVGDVNGNGSTDFALAVGSDADAVYMVDGAERGVHHRELWSFEGSDAFFTLAALGDIDGDDVVDLAAGSGDNADEVHALSGADGSELWSLEAKGSVLDLAALPDVDGDGVDEVVVGSWSSSDGVMLLDGATGDIVWSSGALDTFVMLVVPYDDVNDDGVAEIAVASWANDAYVLDGRTGSTVWTSPTGGDVWAIDRVDDVTGDGISEIVFGSFDGFAYLADGLDGTVLWIHDAGGHKVLAVRAGDDVDGDGNPEVLLGAQQLDAGEDDLVWLVSADSGIASSGPEIAWEGEARPGGEITFTVTQATPGRTLRWIWGTAPTLVPVDGIGTIAVTPRNALAETVIDENGSSSTEFAIPDDPTVVDRTFYVQAIEVIDPSGPEGIATHRVGFTIER